MPPWSPNDPYGVDTLRKVLMTFALFLVVFGTYRALSKGDPFEYFALAATISFLLGFGLEATVRWFDRGRGQETR